MSAETLRRAAALMRERAEASLSPSPWCAEENSVWDADDHLVIASNVDILDDDIPHIASWHPAVALAVADWLEEVAERQKPSAHWDRRSHGWTGSRVANAVASAYLGSDV